MTRTLRFGFDSRPMHSRIERYVTRRRSPTSFDAARAAEDYARAVAYQVSPGNKRSDCPHSQTLCIRGGLMQHDCPICSGWKRAR